MPDDVAVSIVEMQALLLGTETIQEFLAEMAALAVLTVGDGLSCGITLQTNGRPLTVASTDALAAQVDEVQYGLDQGPCLHALRTGTLVSIEDLASDQRWAAYAATALQHGIRSSLSLPLSSGSGTIGAFNLYSQVTGSFGPAATRRAKRFAHNASGALSIAVRMADHVALTDQLRASLDSSCGHRPGDRRAHGPTADHCRGRVRDLAHDVAEPQHQTPGLRCSDRRGRRRAATPAAPLRPAR